MSNKPDYEGALQDLMKILKDAEKRKGLPSKPSVTEQAIEDVTEESSETAYQFTDLDLTVIKNTTAEDDADEKNE